MFLESLRSKQGSWRIGSEINALNVTSAKYVPCSCNINKPRSSCTFFYYSSLSLFWWKLNVKWILLGEHFLSKTDKFLKVVCAYVLLRYIWELERFWTFSRSNIKVKFESFLSSNETRTYLDTHICITFHLFLFSSDSTIKCVFLWYIMYWEYIEKYLHTQRPLTALR